MSAFSLPRRSEMTRWGQVQTSRYIRHQNHALFLKQLSYELRGDPETAKSCSSSSMALIV
jgi:hypothetical protein